MQTFLPYPDFVQCAKVLDGKRLRKQIVECYQILNTLNAIARNLKVTWMNHPAVRMWEGYEFALIDYSVTMRMESLNRGYTSRISFPVPTSYNKPKWLGNKFLHLSHQANLIRKNEEYYKPFFGNVSPEKGYWWPIITGPNSKKHTEMWENKCLN